MHRKLLKIIFFKFFFINFSLYWIFIYGSLKYYLKSLFHFILVEITYIIKLNAYKQEMALIIYYI